MMVGIKVATKTAIIAQSESELWIFGQEMFPAVGKDH